jgi:general L-amino acid transport system permease protein
MDARVTPHVGYVVPDRPARPGIGTRLERWIGPRPLLQLAVVAGLVVGLWSIAATLFENMARVGLTPGFTFLGHAANFEIGEAPIAFAAGDSYFRAFTIGLLNTVRVALVGCVLATVLGVALGVARLSTNPLLGRTVQVWIEIVRNTPLLLQLFFWIALLQALPPPRRALEPLPGVLVSNRGLSLPLPEVADGGWIGVAVAGFALIAVAVGLTIRRRRIGPAPRRVAASLLAAAIVVPIAAGWAFGAVPRFDVPRLAGFNIRGGIVLTPEFAALLVGLAINASASIAETVRAAILAVPTGQREAARALGLPPFGVMRLVVLPQAIRIVLPVLTSSWLSLTKNSSLAVAIGYPDLVSILNTTANVTGQALEAIAVMMAVYLALSLTTSAVSTGWERRRALREGRRS